MKKFALLGHEIDYSLSPRIHTCVFRTLGVAAEYGLVSASSENLADAVHRLRQEADGFNVTKPHKLAVVPFLHKNSSPFAAVNTVCVRPEGLVGYNTDADGFQTHFAAVFGAIGGLQTLVLGAGGAAVVAVHALSAMGANVTVYNRTFERGRDLAARYGCAAVASPEGLCPQVIVNCTSAGLHGEQSLPPTVSLDRLQFAYDMIYAPPMSPFLQAAAAAGAQCENGLGMLIGQALRADELFLQTTFSQEEYNRLTDKIRRELQCGKF